MPQDNIKLTKTLLEEMGLLRGDRCSACNTNLSGMNKFKHFIRGDPPCLLRVAAGEGADVAKLADILIQKVSNGAFVAWGCDPDWRGAAEVCRGLAASLGEAAEANDEVRVALVAQLELCANVLNSLCSTPDRRDVAHPLAFPERAAGASAEDDGELLDVGEVDGLPEWHEVTSVMREVGGRPAKQLRVTSSRSGESGSCVEALVGALEAEATARGVERHVVLREFLAAFVQADVDAGAPGEAMLLQTAHDVMRDVTGAAKAPEVPTAAPVALTNVAAEVAVAEEPKAVEQGEAAEELTEVKDNVAGLEARFEALTVVVQANATEETRTAAALAELTARFTELEERLQRAAEEDGVEETKGEEAKAAEEAMVNASVPYAQAVLEEARTNGRRVLYDIGNGQVTVERRTGVSAAKFRFADPDGNPPTFPVAAAALSRASGIEVMWLNDVDTDVHAQLVAVDLDRLIGRTMDGSLRPDRLHAVAQRTWDLREHNLVVMATRSPEVRDAFARAAGFEANVYLSQMRLTAYGRNVAAGRRGVTGPGTNVLDTPITAGEFFCAFKLAEADASPKASVGVTWKKFHDPNHVQGGTLRDVLGVEVQTQRLHHSGQAHGTNQGSLRRGTTIGMLVNRDTQVVRFFTNGHCFQQFNITSSDWNGPWFVFISVQSGVTLVEFDVPPELP